MPEIRMCFTSSGVNESYKRWPTAVGGAPKTLSKFPCWNCQTARNDRNAAAKASKMVDPSERMAVQTRRDDQTKAPISTRNAGRKNRLMRLMKETCASSSGSL